MIVTCVPSGVVWCVAPLRYAPCERATCRGVCIHQRRAGACAGPGARRGGGGAAGRASRERHQSYATNADRSGARRTHKLTLNKLTLSNFRERSIFLLSLDDLVKIEFRCGKNPKVMEFVRFISGVMWKL